MFPWPPNSPTNLHATHHRHADGADRSGSHAEKMNADQAVYCAREWMGRNKDGANLRQGLGGCCTQPVDGCKLDRRVHRQGDRTYTKGSYPATHVAAVCTCVYRQEIKQTLWFEQRGTYTPSRCVQKQIKKRKKKKAGRLCTAGEGPAPPPPLCPRLGRQASRAWRMGASGADDRNNTGRKKKCTYTRKWHYSTGTTQGPATPLL